MKHSAPARGALAGVKADAQKAKEARDAGGVYDPRAAGAAWTHNFLNQKPWHPLNFRNQQKVFEAEQESISQAKRHAEAKAQFEAEQEQMQALSYLSTEGRKEYAARQSLAFMYMKPPGLDAALAKAPAVQPQGPGPSTSAQPPEGGGTQSQSHAQGSSAEAQQPPHKRARTDAGGRSSVGNMLGAMAALQQHEKWEMKHVSTGMSRSPPRGGADEGAANQQFLVSSSDEDAPPDTSAQVQEVKGDKVSKSELKRRKLEEAKELLRQHGVALPVEDLSQERSLSKKSKHKKSKKKKSKHRAKD